MKKIKMRISEERKSKDLESWGSILMPLAKMIFSAEDMVETDIILNWQDIIGVEFAAFCRPLKAKYDARVNIRTVFIEVPAGGFALELQHKEKYLLEKINTYFGYNAVHKLNISQNMNMQLPIWDKTVSSPQPEKVLALADEKYLQELVDDIKDDKLKEILLKLGKSVILAQKGE